MKGKLCSVLILFYLPVIINAQEPDSCKVSFSFEKIAIQKVFENISRLYGISFSYQSNLPDLQKKVSVKAQNLELRGVLQKVLSNTRLSFKFLANQVVVFPKPENLNSNFIIQGRIFKTGTSEPIAYAGMELIHSHKGTISDIHGMFRIEIDAEQSVDTLVISSLNYHPVRVPVKHLTLQGLHTLYMTERIYELPVTEIKGIKQKFEIFGNHKRIPSGSFYLDTHGQQTALFINNENDDIGKLISASFYLSKNGNTDAPFRVHVYLPDSTTGKPGEEILPEIIIIKPNKGKGWYNINLSRFKIDLPPNGIFIAIEGIFPGEYDAFYDDSYENSEKDSKDNSDEFEGETISYGQQIGYSGGNENKTWHYAIDHTWFQLKKKRFNAMISAEFKINKNKNSRGFFGIFGYKKKKIKNIEI